MSLRFVVELTAFFFLRLISATGVLVLSYALSKVGGVDLVGEFLRVFSYSLAFGTLMRFGADYYLVRYIGVGGFSAACSGGGISSVLFLVIIISAASLVLVSVFDVGYLLMANEKIVLFFGCVLAVNYILSAVFKGIKKSYLSPLMESGFCLLLISVYVLLCAGFGVHLDVERVFVVALIAVSMQSLLAAALLYFFKEGVPLQIISRREFARHTSESLSYFPIVVLGFLSEWGGVVILGVVWTSDALGVWGMLHKTSYLMVFVLVVINALMSPRYAHLAATSKTALYSAASRVTFFLWLLAVPLIWLVVNFSREILSIFSADLVSFNNAFLILVAAQAVNLATGSCGDLLNMSGNQKANAYISAISTFVSTSGAVLVALLHGGIMEMAIVVGAAIVIKNVGQFLVVRLVLGYWCLPPPFIKSQVVKQ